MSGPLAANKTFFVQTHALADWQRALYLPARRAEVLRLAGSRLRWNGTDAAMISGKARVSLDSGVTHGGFRVGDDVGAVTV